MNRPSRPPALPPPQTLAMMPRGESGNPSMVPHEVTHTLNDLLLTPSVRDAIQQVLLEHAHADALRAAGCAPACKLMFEGPPGTGKTSVAGAIARALDAQLFVVQQHEMINSHMGESDKAIARAFDYARQRSGVFLLDEFDTYASDRAAGDDPARSALNGIVTVMLAMLDRHVGPGIVVAATNRIDSIDPAARRRFDVEVEFEMPDAEMRLDLIRRTLGDTSDIALDVVTRTKGSHADIVRACMAEKKRRILAEIVASEAQKPKRPRNARGKPDAKVTKLCSHEVGHQPASCPCDADCYCRDALCAVQRELGVG
jgi:SpoVK/Ycf46/Vps4 family AAA+-type ATPase